MGPRADIRTVKDTCHQGPTPSAPAVFVVEIKPTCQPPRALSEHTTEEIVRWYLLNGGSPGCPLHAAGEGNIPSGYGATEIRGTIAMTLAQCPFRLRIKGTERSITPLEQAVIAELHCERHGAFVRYLEEQHRLGVIGTRRNGLTDLEQAYREWDTWDTKHHETRAKPIFRACIRWLAAAFGLVVYGDPARGINPDLGFLEVMCLEAA